MYQIIDIDTLIDNKDLIFAHDSFGNKETLQEHSDNTLRVFEKINNKKNIIGILDKALSKISISKNNINYGFLPKESKDLIIDMFVNAIFMHDIGKINPKFQLECMHNLNIDYSNIKYMSTLKDNHPFLSAAVFIDQFSMKIEKINSSSDKFFTTFMMMSFSQIIANHHVKLINLSDYKWKDGLTKGFENCMTNMLKECPGAYDYFYKGTLDIKLPFSKLIEQLSKVEFDCLSVYIINKLLESLIVSCDFMATYAFINKESINDVSLNNISQPEDIYDKYKQSDIYQNIERYNKDHAAFGTDSINTLRCEMFNKAEKTLLSNLESDIFNLRMPTGAGKTNVSINLALQLCINSNLDKIFYIFPFNTLVDQTDNFFNNLFKDSLDYAVINSVSDPPVKYDVKDNIDYSKSLLDLELMDYQMVLTSNVRLFNILFGTGRINSMSLFQLINSVIILDEIQSYKNWIWKEMSSFLSKYAELFNIKIIIMSATMPNLQKLIHDKSKPFVELIEDYNYYCRHPYFLSRAKIEYLENDMDFEKLYKHILRKTEVRNKEEKHSKIMVEFINKASAKLFYKLYKNKFKNFKVFELTGDDNSYERQKIISYITAAKDMDILLITTQVIEAGVDIDMDIGFKDISLWDSEIQFLGRINRSNLHNNCSAYFFNMDVEAKIYKNDLRLGKSIKLKKYQDMLKRMQSDEYYEEITESLNKEKSKLNHNNYKVFLSMITQLKYENIEEYMKLINDTTFRIFIPAAYEINGQLVDGRLIWKQYLSILQDKRLNFSEKSIKLLKLNKLINLFTFKVYGSGISGALPVGDIYYIVDGIDFLYGNKFDLELFKLRYTIINYKEAKIDTAA